MFSGRAHRHRPRVLRSGASAPTTRQNKCWGILVLTGFYMKSTRKQSGTQAVQASTPSACGLRQQRSRLAIGESVKLAFLCACLCLCTCPETRLHVSMCACHPCAGAIRVAITVNKFANVGMSSGGEARQPLYSGAPQTVRVQDSRWGICELGINL